MYNSPVQLYSKDTLAMEADNPAIGQATYSQAPPHKEPSLTRGQESATHQASVAVYGVYSSCTVDGA